MNYAPDFIKAERRFRARVMLPLEMLLFTLQLALAIIGGMTDSGIYRMLMTIGLASQWSTAVAGIGVTGLVVALAEWRFGATWSTATIRRSCGFRMWASLFSVVTWAYLGHTIFFYTEYTKAIFPMVIGPVCIVFHLWCALAVKRVGVLLDPEKDTRALEARLDRRRVAA